MPNVKNVYVETTVKHYALCHECGQPIASISHLMEDAKKAGRYEVWNWDHNGDHACMATTSFVITYEGGNDYSVTYSPGTVKRTWVPCTVLMELPPQEKSIFLVVKTNCHLDDETPSGYPNSDYHYNEGTCPTNWIREVKEIHYDGDDDPHGLFRYVRTTRPIQTGEDRKEGWANELFPEILQGVVYGKVNRKPQQDDAVSVEAVVTKEREKATVGRDVNYKAAGSALGRGLIIGDQDEAKVVCFNESLLSIDPSDWPSDLITHSRESLIDYIKMLGLKHDVQDSDVVIGNMTGADFVYNYSIHVKNLLWGFSNKPFQSPNSGDTNPTNRAVNKPMCTFRIFDKGMVLAGETSSTYQALVAAINDLAPWLKAKLEDLQVVVADRPHLKYDILLNGHKVGDVDGPFVKHTEL